jgi:hypothetical protein
MTMDYYDGNNRFFTIFDARRMRSPKRVLSVALFVVTASLAVTLSVSTMTAFPSAHLAFAQVVNNKTYSIDSKPYGTSYGDWGAKWWQWAASIPTNKSPLKDNTGANCAQGQGGTVWFLAGTFGGGAERTCTIPAGKSIFFPIFNNECSYAEYPQYKTEQELKACATGQIDKVTNLDATVDGTKIPDLQKYRAMSSPYDLTLVNNNVFGVKPGTTRSVSDGFWIMLQPLSAGKHDIHFSGSSVDFAASGPVNFATAVTYHLNVQ